MEVHSETFETPLHSPLCKKYGAVLDVTCFHFLQDYGSLTVVLQKASGKALRSVWREVCV